MSAPYRATDVCTTVKPPVVESERTSEWTTLPAATGSGGALPLLLLLLLVVDADASLPVAGANLRDVRRVAADGFPRRASGPSLACIQSTC